MIARAFFRRAALSLAALAFSAALAFAPSASATDYSDNWWTEGEVGWGAQLNQYDNFLFITLYIYGQDKSPTWFTAQLTWDGTSAFTGQLYSTIGSYYAAPWNNAEHPAPNLVGSASFTPTSSYQGTLVYTVNGVGTVTKTLSRIPLAPITLAGSYSGGQAGGYFNCTNNGNNGAYTDSFDLTLTQGANNTVSFVFAYSSLSCTFTGTLEQHGTLFNVNSATYTCNAGTNSFNTTANMSEIKATSLGIEGRFTAGGVPGGCTESANFSAVLH
jgi:hypothetical protein